MVDWNWKDQTGSGDILKGVDGKPKKRVGDPPPCERCPKVSPEKEHEHVLSAKNWQAYEFAKAVKATCGACLVGRARTDSILLQNLAIIEDVTRQAEQYQLFNAISCVPRS
jgi:hypothetical protein